MGELVTRLAGVRNQFVIIAVSAIPFLLAAWWVAR